MDFNPATHTSDIHVKMAASFHYHALVIVAQLSCNIDYLLTTDHQF